MKIHALVLAFGGVVGVATFAQAQPAAPADPLADLQGVFGTVVGTAFNAPDPIVDATNPPGSPGRALGGALRTSLEVPGAVFAGVIQPFAAADQGAPAAPAPAPRHRPHARVSHHRAPAQG